MELATPSFEDCVSYALAQLKMTEIELKVEQLSAIEGIYCGKDVFVWLPTGYGKSLCYQALPFLLDYKRGLSQSQESSLVIVVSPLIALMIDQTTSLRSRQVKCSIIASSVPKDSISKNLMATDSSLLTDSLLFCTPESLIQSKWRHSIDRSEVSQRVMAFVVDEAHCVSKWSRDFRPSFSRLAEVRSLVPPRTPCMTCTATATRSVRKEVIKTLEMNDCLEISVSPDRPNIYYEVRNRTEIEDDMGFLVELLREKLIYTPRMIVYCQSLDTCSNLFAHFLHSLGEKSFYPSGAQKLTANRLFAMYHSCTPPRNKDTILKSLRQPDGIVRVIFATIALGMGIDLQDVNTIIHYGAPRSLEDYFQESGRGGRSGASARSLFIGGCGIVLLKQNH